MAEKTLLDALVTSTLYGMSVSPRTPVGSRAEARHGSRRSREVGSTAPHGKEWTEANGIQTNKVSNTI
ncbi:hypothetical protein ACERII_01690 [Evansella sp. AB-rgal1]|uniref:hypothetical protein n=1 Tax=Evansella sp. AB-rgal1 TaxID=3242696 RepID=UPI00359D2F82